MTDRELIRSLQRLAVVEDPAFRCIGCGHEHNCSIHGCKILREAAARVQALTDPEAAAPAYPLVEEDPTFVPGIVTEVIP